MNAAQWWLGVPPAHVLELGVAPQAWDPFIDRVDEQALRTHFARLRSAIAGTVSAMPDHADYIARHACAGPVDGSARRGWMDYTALPPEMERLPTAADGCGPDRP